MFQGVFTSQGFHIFTKKTFLSGIETSFKANFPTISKFSFEQNGWKLFGFIL